MSEQSPVPPSPRVAVLRTAGGAIALTVVASALGALGWPSPVVTGSGWQVAEVPPRLLALLGTVGLGSLVVAALLVRPWSWRAPVAAVVWWVLVLLSVFAGVWNDLYYAALSGSDGPIIPVFDWLFTFLPALLAGLVTRRHGRPVQLQAGLGTAVVSLPLLGLGTSLYDAPDGFVAGLSGGVFTATVLGCLPLAIALALSVGSTRPAAQLE